MSLCVCTLTEIENGHDKFCPFYIAPYNPPNIKAWSDYAPEPEDLPEDYTPTRGSVLFIIPDPAGDVKLTKGDNIGIHAGRQYYSGEFLGIKSFYIYIKTGYGTEIGFELSDMSMEIEPLD